jgi:hypothetical protein
MELFPYSHTINEHFDTAISQGRLWRALGKLFI